MITTETVVCPDPTCRWSASVSIETDQEPMPWRRGVIRDAVERARLTHVVAVHVEERS